VSEKPTVVEALASVMADVQAIKKGDYNDNQKFNFRGVDAVVNAVGPVLRKHNVVVVPTGAHYDQERYQTTRGTSMRAITVSVCYRFYGPAGDYIDANVLGEAADSGDKAISKAFSVAYRTLLLQTLCVPTDEIDPDAQSHEADPHGLRAGRADAPQDRGATDLGQSSTTAAPGSGAATPKQKAMIRALCKELGLKADDLNVLTKQGASERISELMGVKAAADEAAAMAATESDLAEIPFMASEF